jgi:hypothetical protein
LNKHLTLILDFSEEVHLTDEQKEAMQSEIRKDQSMINHLKAKKAKPKKGKEPKGSRKGTILLEDISLEFGACNLPDMAEACDGYLDGLNCSGGNYCGKLQ